MRTMLGGLVALGMLSGCATPGVNGSGADREFADVRETLHRGDDDLLTAGLGLAGLRTPSPPLVGTEMEEPERLRRLAIHSNWRGLVDLTATGGFGEEAELPRVPGREFHAFHTLPGRRHPVRLMVQIPDTFDPDQPCLVVAPVSGSRGIYGGVPVAGPWALPRGCALASTDKGAGTDLYDHASNTGVTLDGTRAEPTEGPLGLRPDPAPAPLVSVPHAHSGDHPEADWGRHTLIAARFGLAMLERLHPQNAPFTPDRVRIIGAAISNGGNALLRALELDDQGLFDAAVAAAPNITLRGERHLFDYATEAALYQPCLLADPEVLTALPFGNPMLLPTAAQRCESLHDAGLLPDPAPASARAHLEARGFEPQALEQAAVNSTLDVWRSVAAIYASSYLRTPVDAMPCGYGIAVFNDEGQPVPADEDTRNRWWATASGVVPGAGLNWIDGRAEQRPADPAFPGLLCLRQLWTGQDRTSATLRAAVADTLASGRVPDIPVIVLHGRDDGLIPAAFSARPWVEAARASGATELEYREIDRAQHFDALVPFPGMQDYEPLIPMVWEALDTLE